ncbi:MAG: hypothetical protein WBB62_08715 [Rhodococcus sp. (in: high G+C Gram-positive bacteria)]
MITNLMVHRSELHHPMGHYRATISFIRAILLFREGRDARLLPVFRALIMLLIAPPEKLQGI